MPQITIGKNAEVFMMIWEAFTTLHISLMNETFVKSSFKLKKNCLVKLKHKFFATYIGAGIWSVFMWGIMIVIVHIQFREGVQPKNVRDVV